MPKELTYKDYKAGWKTYLFCFFTFASLSGIAFGALVFNTRKNRMIEFDTVFNEAQVEDTNLTCTQYIEPYIAKGQEKPSWNCTLWGPCPLETYNTPCYALEQKNETFNCKNVRDRARGYYCDTLRQVGLLVIPSSIAAFISAVMLCVTGKKYNVIDLKKIGLIIWEYCKSSNDEIEYKETKNVIVITDDLSQRLLSPSKEGQQSKVVTDLTIPLVLEDANGAALN